MEQRRYDIDWIRSIVVLSIIFFHSCIIYIMQDYAVIYVKSNVNLPLCHGIQIFMSTFHMVILFFLAGMSVYYSMRKRQAGQFLSSRVKKILIPFILGNVLLNPVTGFIHSCFVGEKMSFIDFYGAFFTSVSNNFEGLTPGYTPMHLWFLLYLFVFSILGLPIFIGGKSQKAQRLLNKAAAFFSRPFAILLLIVPYPLFFIVNILYDKNPIAYFYVFLAGYLFATSPKYQEALDRDKWGYLGLTVLSMAAWLIYINVYGRQLDSKIITDVMKYNSGFLMVLECLTILTFAHSYIPNKKTKLLAYLSKVNFPIYVYHMLVLAIVTYGVLQLKINPYLQWLMINLLTYAVCFGIYKVAEIMWTIVKRVKELFQKQQGARV